MNTVEATFVLKGRPLRFGDTEQIEAVKYLSEIERLQEIGEGECEECKGTGEAECITCNQMAECEACEGFGVTVMPDTENILQRNFVFD